MARTSGLARVLRIDPEQLDQLHYGIEVRYELQKPQNLAIDIQNAERLVADGFMAREDASTRIIGIEDPQVQERKRLRDLILADPQVLDVLKQEALKLALPQIQERQAREQAITSLDQFLRTNPSLAQVVASAALPGSPGYSAAQQFLERFRQFAGPSAPQGPGASPAQPRPQPYGQPAAAAPPPMPAAGPGASPAAQPGGARPPGMPTAVPGGPRGQSGV